MLAFFISYNLEYRKSIFSMSWWNVIFLSKFGSASNILSFAVSMFWIASESSIILPRSFLLGHRHPFYHSLFCSFTSIVLPSLSSSSCRSRVLWTVPGSIFLHSVISSITHLYSIQILLVILSLFVSFLHFHLCWPIASFSRPFMHNVMWVYHWETEGNRTICFDLCAFWKKCQHWSLINT